ncbi:hypothetical protein ECANGB1_1139 [Enterospora canceri]|uniref:Uncharacterized protein n=1 Tax=Enterospora canceri TaxID=1081671 RepID=A0A1Y1S7F1_9MICR|nr:hypothetical protein ECANGB1_1139 [Enterospora canceri]
MPNKYNKLIEKNKKIHDSLLQEINSTSKKAKRKMTKNVESVTDRLQARIDKIVKDFDKKIVRKKQEMAKLTKKVDEINKMSKNLKTEDFLTEAKELKNQILKLIKDKISYLGEFKENQSIIYDKEFEKLTKRTNKTMDGAKKEINESFTGANKPGD